VEIFFPAASSVDLGNACFFLHASFPAMFKLFFFFCLVDFLFFFSFFCNAGLCGCRTHQARPPGRSAPKWCGRVCLGPAPRLEGECPASLPGRYCALQLQFAVSHVSHGYRGVCGGFWSVSGGNTLVLDGRGRLLSRLGKGGGPGCTGADVACAGCG
jgi:hypothetical protein